MESVEGSGAGAEAPAESERQAWIRGSVSRRRFLLGAGLIGIGAMAAGTVAGRWMLPGTGTRASSPAQASGPATPSPSAAPTAGLD